MPTPNYPALPSGSLPDDKQFSVSAEDPTHRSDIEGGYEVTRPKHTRKPRRDFDIAYRNLTQADKDTLDDFYDDVTGSVVFSWLNPQDLKTYLVRFKEGGIAWKYAGIGPTKRWNCSFKLGQA